jgi:hypothetical protein
MVAGVARVPGAAGRPAELSRFAGAVAQANADGVLLTVETDHLLVLKQTRLTGC